MPNEPLFWNQYPGGPALSVYQTDVVEPGEAIVMGDKVFLHPSVVHQLRKQVFEMQDTPRRETRVKKRPPLLARIAAAIIVGGLIIWGVASCGASLAQGARYSECIQQAKDAGQTVDEFIEHDCMKESK